MNRLLLLLIIQLVFASVSFAEVDYSLLFKNGVFVPRENKGLLIEEEQGKVKRNTTLFAGIQFYAIPTLEQQKALKSMGVKLGGYMKNKAYTAVIPQDALEELKHFGVRSIFGIDNKYKIDSRLGGYGENGEEITVWVQVFEGFDFEEAHNLVREKDFEITFGHENFRQFEVKLHSSRLQQLSSIPCVIWIEPTPPENISFNLPGVRSHRANVLQSTIMGQRGLTGKGVFVGEWDGAGVGNHIDYNNRLTNIDPFVSGGNGNHSTHVCGTFAGAGNRNPFAKGMAPEVRIFAWDFIGNITMEMDTGIVKYPFVITQNSYGYNPAGDPCVSRGTYDINSYGIDVLVNTHPHLLHVFANGNSRGNNCVAGGFRTVGSGYQSAKNVLTVGAVTGEDVNSTFSSYGPTIDGRIKPDVTAVGVDVYSTFPNDNYQGGYNGTSMACPGVSGTSALLYEHFRNLNSGQNPFFHTLKAALCNTARDLGNKGPDFSYGYGRIDGDKAAEVLENNLYLVDSLSQGDTLIKKITIGPGSNTKEMKIFLCWQDVPALSSVGTTLVNNLDLVVIDPLGNIIRPLVPNFNVPTSVAIQRIDTLNTNEQIVIENPIQGEYTVLVVGTEVPAGTPTFTLTWWETEPFIRLSYPFGGETWLPPSAAASAQRIAWDAYGMSGNFSIEFSADSGATWQILVNNLDINNRFWNWQTASDTLNTNKAFIKITATGSSGFESQNIVPFTILNNPQLGGPDAVTCSERITLTWKPNSIYESYNVHQLVNGEMQIVGNTSDSFFVVRDLVDFERNWFALSGIANGGYESPRSLARLHVAGGSLKAPEIIQQPLVENYCTGDTVVLISKATGTQNIFSRWEYSQDQGNTWDTIPLEHSDTLALIVKSFNNNLWTRNAYYNQCGGFEYTNELFAIIDTVIDFVQSPTQNLLCIGDSATFSVLPSSLFPPKFHWEMSFDLGVVWNKITGSDSQFTIGIGNVSFDQSGRIFRVVAENNCGMFTSNQARLIVRPPLSVSLPADTTLCTGQTLPLIANTSGGDTSNYIFSWTPTGENTHSIIANPSTTRTYRVILSDACTPGFASDTIRITRREPLSIELYNSDTTICIGSSINTQVKVKGGLPGSYTLRWLFDTLADTSETFSPSQSGYYGFKVEDGCSQEIPADSFMVNFFAPLSVTIDPVDTLCFGQTALLKANPSGGLSSAYELVWDNGAKTGNEYSVLPLTTSAYTVSLKDNCTVTPASQDITVNVRAPLSLNLVGPSEVCFGDSITLNTFAFGGRPATYEYIWQPSAPNQTFFSSKPTQTNNYQVQLRDGCSPPISRNMIVQVNPLPSMGISVTPNPLCSDRVTRFRQINATPNSPQTSVVKIGNNIVQNNNLDFEFSLSAAGFYDVELNITDVKGCSNDTVYNNLVQVVAMPNPDFTFTPPVTDIDRPRITFTNQSTNATSVLWDLDFGISSNANVVNYEYTDTGWYNITLTAYNSLGCDSSITKTLRINDVFRAHIPTAFSPGSDGLNDTWLPVMRGVKEYHVKIFNRKKSLVYESTDMTTGWNGKINNTDEFAGVGVYVFVIVIIDINGQIHEEKGTIFVK